MRLDRERYRKDKANARQTVKFLKKQSRKSTVEDHWKMKTDKEKLDTFLKDSYDDEERIIELAQQVLPKEWLDGDSYVLPDIVEITEKLVEIIKKHEDKKES